MKAANRRKFLAWGPVLGGALVGCSSEKKQQAATEDDGPNRLGKPISEYGDRSEFEKAKRLKPDRKSTRLNSSHRL